MIRRQARAREWWRRSTLRRHRSELRALRLARKLGPLAIFPIFLTIAFWWLVLGLPCLVVGIPALSLTESAHPIHRLVGGALFLPVSIYAIAILCVAAPWFFHWYFIAAGLMLGRDAMADRKEAELIAAIGAAEVS